MWTLLCALMAYSSWRIWNLPANLARRSTALVLFSAQLVLNTLWSWMFFGPYRNWNAT
ncbi:hypothetical protein BSK43_015685 [Rhizobium sp. P44RR-XXIV]|nr:hypothetical protein BSK43_015685 [Rhizobium sp. P44RR-XXIV]